MPPLIHYKIVWIVLISIFLFTLPRISTRFAAPGSFALAISFPIVLGLYSICGTGLYIKSNMAILSMGIVFILTISTMLSDRPDMAIKHLIIYTAAVFIGIAFAGYNVWPVVMLAAVIHSVFICTPLTKKNAGLMGNSNFAGAFLAPYVFIAFYINQPACVVLFIFTLFMTKCRGGTLGVIIGSFFINPFMPVVLIALLLPFIFIKRFKPFFRYGSLMGRLGMWKSSLKFLTVKRLLFGIGGDVGRISFIKDRTHKDRMRRLHSDIIQGIFDGGIFYVILYLWIGIYSISIAPPALAAALTSLMIAGLFVDTQLVHFTSVLFWLLIGQINYSLIPVVIVAPWMLPIAIIIFILSVQTWGRAFAADTILGLGINRSDARLVAIAHKINPDDSFATANVVRIMIVLKQYGPAFDKAWRMVDRYDGELKPDIPYYILAVAAYNVGAMPIAQVMAERTLMYCKHKEARELLVKIEKEKQLELKRIKKRKRK